MSGPEIIRAWRGQHSGAATIEGRMRTLALGTRRTAEIYATCPNNRADRVVRPLLFEVELRAAKPF